MDINVAALKLKQIEIIEGQIKHLQDESRLSSNISYAQDCHDRIQDLVDQMDGIIDE